MKSDEFRTMWAAHNVKRKTHASLRITHPLLSVYHADTASASEEGLRLLTSWGTDATQDWSSTTAR